MTDEYYTPLPVDDSPVKAQALVKEFINLTGQEATASLYEKLFNEELEEFLEAGVNFLHDSTKEKFAEFVKEAADLQYVLNGLMVASGVDFDKAYKRVHDNNVGRCLQPDGTVKRRDDGKIEKNKSWPKVELLDLIPDDIEKRMDT